MLKLKPGDTVFVVMGRKNGGDEYASTVSSVGRKYGTIIIYGREQQFRLDDGASHHTECNSRHNGYGFDVYASETEYREQQRAAAEFERLEKRMTRQYQSGLLTLTAETVAKIHAVLDEADRSI